MAPYAASIEDSRRKLQFDLYYIKHMSFFLDVFIFVKTVKTDSLRPRARKALGQNHTSSHPRYPEVKTETLSTIRGRRRRAKLAEETDERRRPSASRN